MSWPSDPAVAKWWQDGFTDGADPEYEEQILPLFAAHLVDPNVPARVLDIGTGEGQLARLARKAGVEHVVGVDTTPAQIAEAAHRAGGPRYVRADATNLPFADGAFDVAVACLVFEHITDMDAAIAEVGRVIEQAKPARFLFFLNHPLLQTPNSGWIDDHILCEQYWRIGQYLVEDVTDEEVERGVVIPFVHRPLSRYVNALSANGFLVTHMEEPAPPPGFLAKADEYSEAATIPRLLFLRCERR